MKYQELIVLLPCHSLEDFPTHYEGEEAEGLLSAWSALWHPALLSSAGKAPTWYRVDDPPEELQDRLIIVPAVSQSQLPTGFAQRAKAAGARLIRRKSDRAEMVAEALADLEGGDRGVPAETVAEFLALGYCHLQVELLTRQMRYSSNLDEVHFHNEALAAASAAVAGDATACHDKLAACFDLLAEERDHYYSVDAFLLDMLLIAASTLGPRLREELSRPTPINLLLPADVLDRLAADEPESLQCVREAVEAGRASLIGGEAQELRLPLLGVETLLDNLRLGLSTYEATLGFRPKVYGRRRFGLVPFLPQLLSRLGFEGALHATLDDGRFPEGSQVKTRWEGAGDCTIDSVARPPLNASQPETFLSYASKLGESMDMDHVATVFLARWPGEARRWMDDVRIIAEYTAALGKPLTAESYFRDTDVPPHVDTLEADRYRSPYLKQSVIRREANPISSSIKYWRERVMADCGLALDALVGMLNGSAHPRLRSLSETVHRDCENPDAGSQVEPLQAAIDEAAESLSKRLPRRDAPAEKGYLLFNPFSFVRRLGCSAPELAHPPEVARPVYAADLDGEAARVVVDVPPMGFAWVSGGSEQPSARGNREEPTLAADGMLRNEFFEAVVNAQTGALQSVLEYGTRGNRLSQQLAFRGVGGAGRSDQGDESGSYSVMAADRVQVTQASATFGEITSEGRLLDRSGEVLAGFLQRYQIWRGSRVLRIEIELDPQTEPKSDPWNSYYAVRFAWAEESAALWRTVNQTRHPVGAKRFEAPNYIEIDETRGRTTILTGGLPYHRRQGPRMLDSLLITRGESERKFVMGIGVDLPQPMHEALGLLAPTIVRQEVAAPPMPQSSGWLFHVDARNVIATHWEPLLENGRCVGVSVRLLESAGRATRCKMRCLRDVASARQLDFVGGTLGEPRVDGDAIQLEFAPHEWTQLEARWKS